ncbi:MAG TPA: permease prefix domain 2-containing transporter [Vicinamibacterales bacterium]|jgi:hypothetical protein|nr:permease prefix domain 2-containing transporter [Vicinamibacterales bacterium]
MIDTHGNPPRWAQVFLRTVLRPSDIDSVTGDLIEEYREAKYPSLGRLGADAWYVRQALSIVWRVVWPFVVATVALRLLSFPLPRGWNPSVVPAPGVSLLDAFIFLRAGYFGARRTGRLVSGVVIASLTSVVGFPIFFIYAAMRDPSLLRAPVEKPFIAMIVLTLLVIAAGFGMALGTLGTAGGRWLAPTSRRIRAQ